MNFSRIHTNLESLLVVVILLAFVIALAQLSQQKTERDNAIGAMGANLVRSSSPELGD